MSKLSRYVCCVALLTALGSLKAAELPDPEEILRFVDGARMRGQGARIELSLAVQEGARESKRRYRVLDDGVASSIVEFLDPLDRGQKILATPDELWFVSPHIHRAIRVPPAQRVFGAASYGDLAKVRWSQDYRASFDSMQEEILAGNECWRLRLSAHRRSSTYRDILLWVTKHEWIPVQAMYFVASGKLLRVVEFPQARVVQGRLTNNVWVFRTANSDPNRTVLTIESAEPATFSAAQFSRRYLELQP